jgi:uncharacterized protein (TIGR02271 family)
MTHTVVGLFNDADDARDAVEELRDHGFSDSQVDCSMSRTSDTTTGARNTDDDDDNAITRFFKSLFGDEDDARRYSSASRNRSIVTVHATSEEEARRAAEILDDEGAIDVNENGGMNMYNNTSTDMSDTNRGMDRTEEHRIPIVQENLEVGKREVEKGGLHVRSRIVERPVEESVRLREERVWVDRQPVDREVRADGDTFRERDIELTERAEVPIVNKQSRVVEEVRVGKETNERQETVRDTVKNTEVDIDKTPGNRDSRY